MSPYIVPGIRNIDLQEWSSDTIIRAVCTHLELPIDQIKRRNRIQELVTARHLSMYLMKKKTRLTLKSIGQKFGMDHTTAIHGIKSITGFVAINDEPTIRHIAQIERLLNK
jgi:chromosomal replication initiation ATPase DnaA